MKLSKKLAYMACATVLSMAAPSVANAAAVINIGNTPSASGGGGFNDTYTFTVPGPRMVSISLMSMITGPLTDVNLSANYSKLNGEKFTLFSTGMNELITITQMVGPGLQTLNVIGSAQREGSYTGIISFAVPEPTTWAMMLLGFGAVGYALRRRTIKVAYS